MDFHEPYTLLFNVLIYKYCSPYCFEYFRKSDTLVVVLLFLTISLITLELTVCGGIVLKLRWMTNYHPVLFNVNVGGFVFCF